MAERSKGRPFQKGQSGNPGGSSKRSKMQKRINMLCNEELLEIGTRLLRGDMAALDSPVSDDGKTNIVLEEWLKQLIKKGIHESDERIFNTLITRLLGRPKNQIELTGQDGAPLHVLAEEADQNRLLAKVEELRAAREALGGDNGADTRGGTESGDDY